MGARSSSVRGGSPAFYRKRTGRRGPTFARATGTNGQPGLIPRPADVQTVRPKLIDPVPHRPGDGHGRHLLANSPGTDEDGGATAFRRRRRTARPPRRAPPARVARRTARHSPLGTHEGARLGRP